MEKNQFIMIGIAVALVIAVAAPFLASGNPDGLESAFFSIHGAKEFQGDHWRQVNFERGVSPISLVTIIP